jgi:hypothetical protein
MAAGLPFSEHLVLSAAIALIACSTLGLSAALLRPALIRPVTTQDGRYLWAVACGAVSQMSAIWPLLQFGPGETIAVFRSHWHSSPGGWVAGTLFCAGLCGSVPTLYAVAFIRFHPMRVAQRIVPVTRAVSTGAHAEVVPAAATPPDDTTGTSGVVVSMSDRPGRGTARHRRRPAARARTGRFRAIAS